MATNNFDPIKEGATKFDPTANGATPVDHESLMDNPVAKVVDFLAPALKTNYNIIADQTNYPNTLPDAKGNIGQGLSNAATATGHLAEQAATTIPADIGTILNSMGGGALLKNGAKVIANPAGTMKTLAQIPKYLTKQGIAGLTDEAAANSTKAGASIHWDELMNQARQKAIKQFGDNASVRQALDNVISPRTPAGIENAPSELENISGTTQASPNDLAKALLNELKINPDKAISPIDELFSGVKPAIGEAQNALKQTPEQLLQLRRNLVNSYGKSLFQAPSEKGLSALENKVASVVRGTVSDNLHRIAPGTVTPDKLYALHSKVASPVMKELMKLLGVSATAGLVGGEALKAFNK